MTSPVDASLKHKKGNKGQNDLKRLEDAVRPPVSLGWISAHVIMAGGTSAAAWRDPLDLARKAAAGMAGAVGIAGISIESRDEGIGSEEFVKPFRAASEAAGLIRNPLQPRHGRPQSGLEAWAEAIGAETGPGPAETANTLGDGRAGQTLSGIGGDAKADLGNLGSLGVAGAFAALASKGIDDPFRSTSAPSPTGLKASTVPSRHRDPDGTWVETGNPTTRNGLSAPSYGPFAQSAGSPRSTAGPQSVPAAGKRKHSADSKRADNWLSAAGSSRASFTTGTTAPTGTTLSLPPAQSDFEVWAERVTRKLARNVSGPASGSGRTTVPASGNPASPKRIPFIFPEDPETIARFKKLMDAHKQVARASGSPATTGIGPRAGESGSGRVAPVAPLFSGPAGNPGHPAPRPIADEPGKIAYDSIQSPSSTRNPNPGAGPSSPSDSHRIAPRSTAAPGSASAGQPMPPIGNGFGSGNGASVQRHGQSQMEWMDEEDDLAAKLHRLLRRQAKRRGVELP